MTLAGLHRTLGWITLVVFLGTGAYLRAGFPDLYAGDAAARYTYRSNHVYILASALVNLALGSQLAVSTRPGRRAAQGAGSLLLALAPVLLVAAFVLEAPRPRPERLITGAGMLCLALGTLAHMAGRAREERVVSPKD